MARITRRPIINHLRASATSHVIHVRRGKVRRSGTGLAFWFRPLTAALSEVPIDNRDMPMMVHARTQDFQDAAVQATVSYRVANPEVAAERIDFSIDSAHGQWQADPISQLSRLVTESAQQHALAVVAGMTLRAALVDGVAKCRDAISAGLADDERLTATGIEILGVRVLAIQPETEMERALQTPTREEVQQEADRATYERRALAVERERTISENELQSKIELATKEEALLTQEGANAKKRATDAAEADLIAARAMADRERVVSEAAANSTRLTGEAEAAAAKALEDAYAGADPQVMLARAAQSAAGNLPRVGQLTITPDVVTGLLAKLGAPADEPAPALKPASRAKK